MRKYSLLAADYEAIDAELVGASAVFEGKVARHNDGIAPAQGSPFLAKVKSLKVLLKKKDKKFR